MSRPILPQVPPYLNAVPNPANVIQLVSAPGSGFTDQPLGTIALVGGPPATSIYVLIAKTSSTATWDLLGIDSSLYTQFGVVYAATTTGLASTAAGTTGQVLVANTGGAPTFQSLASVNVVDVTSSSQQISVGTTYITDNGASLVTYTLPATASLGQSFSILGKSSGGWKIIENSGQTMHMNSTNSTTTTGSIASTAQYNCITLKCITANTDFVVVDSEGTLTIV